MMGTIVTEELISFKELEKKFIYMYANSQERLQCRCSRTMIGSWQRIGIKSYTGIKENARPASRLFMGKWSIPEMYTVQKQRTARWHMSFCWTRQ